jgi:hypothetical protein
MMERVIHFSRFFAPLLILVSVFVWGSTSASADSPTRQTTITISYTDYEWWLINWSDNNIICQLNIDHEGLPDNDDVYENCGIDVYKLWLSTPPCQVLTKGSKNTSVCSGVYLFLISNKPKEKEVIIDLPVATASITLDGCQLVPPENRCPNLPNLLITGEEPLPNETITSIEGNYEELAFSCPGSSCLIPLKATSMDGANIEFWAVSSFGDTSEHYTAKVRVVDTGVSSSPDSAGWFVDVLSPQWKGGTLASCSEVWDAFPPVGGPPAWLSTPDNNALIASDQAYYYLAGRLIAQGLVSAENCPGGGLLPNGYADACGLENARPFVEEWQNQFDQRIIETAKETDIPAQLLKNLFAQESQFWPGIFKVPYEFGLGQITDNGADAILLWDDDFFNQFCPLILLQDACDQGYLHLEAHDQAILRGALALQAKSDCSECPTGIDLTNVDFSLALFANSIKANCEQVAQIVYNATREMPGSVSTYEDLWRMTVANYHAGPGCISYAVYMAWSKTGNLTWDEVSAELPDPCNGVIPYVEKITK